MKCKNIISVLMTGCFCFPQLTQASGLSDACSNYGGYLHKNVTIINASTSSLPSQDSCMYLELSDNPAYNLEMCPNATSNFSAILKMVTTAVLLQNYVNVCTDKNFFLGIEYTN